MILSAGKDGEVVINPLFEKWPELEAAIYYRLFAKKTYIVLRFYDSKRRWIRVGEQLRTGKT